MCFQETKNAKTSVHPCVWILTMSARPATCQNTHQVRFRESKKRDKMNYSLLYIIIRKRICREHFMRIPHARYQSAFLIAWNKLGEPTNWWTYPLLRIILQQFLQNLSGNLPSLSKFRSGGHHAIKDQQHTGLQIENENPLISSQTWSVEEVCAWLGQTLLIPSGFWVWISERSSLVASTAHLSQVWRACSRWR